MLVGLCMLCESSCFMWCWYFSISMLKVVWLLVWVLCISSVLVLFIGIFVKWLGRWCGVGLGNVG